MKKEGIIRKWDSEEEPKISTIFAVQMRTKTIQDWNEQHTQGNQEV